MKPSSDNTTEHILYDVAYNAQIASSDGWTASTWAVHSVSVVAPDNTIILHNLFYPWSICCCEY